MSVEARIESFERHARMLRGLVYRFTGELSEAEDLLQEARLRWLQVTEQVEHERAYLVRLVTRLALDYQKSARVRRETYTGAWLPEPVLDQGALSLDAEASHELAHDISVALLLTLERLSPLERAAFLLHDVFDVGYGEIAETLGKEEATVRQLASRGRARVRDERPRYRSSKEESERILTAFYGAIASGDTRALLDCLAPDVVFTSDGGGRVSAATQPVYGSDRVARLFFGMVRKWPALARAAMLPVRVNGLPGVVFDLGPDQWQTVAFRIEQGRIREIYTVRNPEKLRHVAALFAVRAESG